MMTLDSAFLFSVPFSKWVSSIKLYRVILANGRRASRVARKIAAGRLLINTVSHDRFAPFGGFKQSGVGREGGIFGLEEYLEPKAIIS